MMEGQSRDNARGVKRKVEADGSDTKGSKKRLEEETIEPAPTEIQVVEYAASRAEEINALEKIMRVKGNMKVQQQLPRHMRRRAMSHNIKRLPKNLRAVGKKDYANQGEKKKRPSRFHRRRPKNLLKEYTRRQRKHIWLETHIWHAKRFHMIEKWGHKLPWKPTSKSERAAYRATSKYCLLQDVSYMCCIEVRGKEQKILDGLSHLTNPQTGPTFLSKACLPGTREGNAMLYQCDKYPYNCIGPVSFIWKPQLPIETSSSGSPENTSTERQLWLWCHPASFHLVWQELVSCFKLADKDVDHMPDRKKADKEISGTDKETAEPESVSVQSGSDENWEQFVVVGTINESLLEKKRQNLLEKDSRLKTPEELGQLKPAICDKFKSEEELSDGEVAIKSLAGSLLRYRLTGPQSNVVLVDALQQANIIPAKNSGDTVKWWHKYYADPECSLGHTQQKEFWDSVGQCLSPAELSPHCVLGLTVTDPRVTRPIKKTKIFLKDSGIDSDFTVCKEKPTENISLSPIWSSSVRESVISTKMSDYQLNRLKEENLVSGFPLSLGDEESKIPVLLIQNPGVTSPAVSRGHDPALGRGSGWDIIIPKGWGMAFWLALVYREARCGGVHEMEVGAFEQSSLLFPHDYPDSVGGKKHQLEVECALVAKYNRRPPAKRPNFVKLGVLSPFYCPWLTLIKSWHEEDCHFAEHGTSVNVSVGGDSYFVLRERRLLRKLANVLEIKSLTFKTGASKNPVYSKEKIEKLETEVFNELRTKYRNSLVPVWVDMIHRGTPATFAQLCIPAKADLESFHADQSYGGPVEQLHTDQKKLDHKKAKRELKATTGKKKIKLKLDRTMKLFSDTEKDAALQISDRKVVGFLNSGGFSLGAGNGHGVGFCSTLGLYHLLRVIQKDVGLLVLVRNASSRQYRFAKLSLIC